MVVFSAAGTSHRVARGPSQPLYDPSMVSEVPSVDLYERMLEESRKKAKNLEDKFAQLMKDKGVSTYCTPLSRN